MVQAIQDQMIETPDSLLDALNRGESLPARWYTDPEITNREIERIFRMSWSYIGPARELANPGDYISGYAGEVPVVVIRNETGLAGFINVCRHRRHEVMKGRGNSKMMRCGYHAWTYDLTGCLKAAPRSAAESNFRLEDYPLLPLRVEVLGPFVFINLDRNAKPLISYFGDLLDIIAGSGVHLETLELYSREDWTAEANWKTMLENYLECYHCAIAHPGFSAAIDVKQENYNLTMHGWFASQLGHVRQSALEGKTAVEIYDPRGEVAQAQYHLLWPNITININPGFPNLSVDVWVPDGPNKAKGFSEQYFGPGVSEQFAHELIAFNKQVGYEDDVLTNSVQRGLIGGIPDRGRFLTNSEHLCIHFQKLVVQAISEKAIASESAAKTSRLPVSTMVSVTPTASVGADHERNAYVELEVAKVERESASITSFYLRRVDGEPVHSWEPGQFLPIRVAIPGHPEPVLRTYSISTRCNPEFYRLSIRRGEGTSLVSQFLEENAKPGFRLQAMMPRGKFVLDRSSGRPVVLVSGGVGITPMIAIAEHIVAEHMVEDGRGTRSHTPIHFIHGTQNSRAHAFGKHVKELANQYPAFNVHIRYSQPLPEDKIGVTHDSVGRIDIDLLTRLLPLGDYDFYLCGPSQFMNSLYSGLTAIGVRPERIHYESFGPGTVLRPEIPRKPGEERSPSPVRVKFARSGIETPWSPEDGTLLELAEEVGLAPAFGCRSGICGTCKTRIIRGAVQYLEEPLADRKEGEILLCCSIPRTALEGNKDSEGSEVVLEL
jgi:ferredoxin-NADP reductase/phenylpropionate dioxygenase-like ring-hydroxylating dioxygenase large terminal subunit